jgi:hypothetical protein
MSDVTLALRAEIRALRDLLSELQDDNANLREALEGASRQLQAPEEYRWPVQWQGPTPVADVVHLPCPF